jgi:thioesterase domain-containing protein
MGKMLDGLGSDGHVLSPLSPHDYDAVKTVCASSVHIISTFAPRRFDGDIHLFVAAASESESLVESWKPYVDGRIRVHRLDCTHDAMMDASPAEKIGKTVAQELDRQRATKQSLFLWRTK